MRLELQVTELEEQVSQVTEELAAAVSQRERAQEEIKKEIETKQVCVK